jgi:hypothetical protein
MREKGVANLESRPMAKRKPIRTCGAHILLPALAPAAFFLVASTPVEVLGCFNRGLMALSVAMVSVVAGIIFAVKGRLARRRGDPDAIWWVVSALILAVPAVGLIILA